MSFTTLLKHEGKVRFLRAHWARLGAVEARREAFLALLRGQRDGVISVRLEGDAFTLTHRPASRYHEGIQTRLLVSPVQTGGARPKQGSPSPYDAVRSEGVATLLTDSTGALLHEACVASLIGCDGGRLVLVPEDTPRVLSIAEAAVASAFRVTRAPLEVDAGLPLLLANAVGLWEPRQSRPFDPGLKAQLLTLYAQAAEPLA